MYISWRKEKCSGFCDSGGCCAFYSNVSIVFAWMCPCQLCFWLFLIKDSFISFIKRKYFLLKLIETQNPSQEHIKLANCDIFVRVHMIGWHDFSCDLIHCFERLLVIITIKYCQCMTICIEICGNDSISKWEFTVKLCRPLQHA